MTTLDFDKLILNFYSQSFLHFSHPRLSVNAQEPICAVDCHAMALEKTNEYATALYKHMLKSWFEELEVRYPELRDKLIHFPQQFWLLDIGKKYYNTLMDKIIQDTIAIVLRAHAENEKIDSTMLMGIAHDLTVVYEKDVKEGKKQVIKLQKELVLNKSIKHLDVELMPILRNSFIQKYREHPQIENILTDFSAHEEHPFQKVNITRGQDKVAQSLEAHHESTMRGMNNLSELFNSGL